MSRTTYLHRLNSRLTRTWYWARRRPAGLVYQRSEFTHALAYETADPRRLALTV